MYISRKFPKLFVIVHHILLGKHIMCQNDESSDQLIMYGMGYVASLL